jgi:hypothetical protein
MTTHFTSRMGLHKVAMSMMIAATAVTGSTALTRTAAADDLTALADLSANDPNGDQQMTSQDGTITQTTTVADRNVIDPGSLARVNQYVNDSNGNTYRAVGFRWTSLGVPHNKLTLTRMVSYVAPDPVSYTVAADPVVVVNSAPTVSYYRPYYAHSYYPYAYAHSYAHSYAHAYSHAYPSLAYSHAYHGGFHHH